jgi:hypothetical protein
MLRYKHQTICSSCCRCLLCKWAANTHASSISDNRVADRRLGARVRSLVPPKDIQNDLIYDVCDYVECVYICTNCSGSSPGDQRLCLFCGIWVCGRGLPRVTNARIADTWALGMLRCQCVCVCVCGEQKSGIGRNWQCCIHPNFKIGDG